MKADITERCCEKLPYKKQLRQKRCKSLRLGDFTQTRINIFSKIIKIILLNQTYLFIDKGCWNRMF